jgi:hypothetical protein
MLIYIKRTNKRLPWHISVGELPLPTKVKRIGDNYITVDYATNTFCGHKIHGFYNADRENPYGSHHVSDQPPSHRLELCQTCVKWYEHKTGQSYDII